MNIFDPIEENKLEDIKALLESNPEEVNARDEEGKTPLHRAIVLQNTDICKLIIKKGADVNARDGITGNTPLYWVQMLWCASTWKMYENGGVKFYYDKVLWCKEVSKILESKGGKMYAE